MWLESQRWHALSILGKISTLHLFGWIYDLHVSTDKQRWCKLSMIGRIDDLHVSTDKQRWRKLSMIGRIYDLHVSTDKQRWRKLSMLCRIYNIHVSIGKRWCPQLNLYIYIYNWGLWVNIYILYIGRHFSQLYLNNRIFISVCRWWIFLFLGKKLTLLGN